MLYGGVLRLNLGEMVETYAYAADLVLVIKAVNKRSLESTTNYASNAVQWWMREHPGSGEVRDGTDCGQEKTSQVNFKIADKSIPNQDPHKLPQANNR